MELLGLAAAFYVLWQFLVWLIQPEIQDKKETSEVIEKEASPVPYLKQVNNCMNCDTPFSGGPAMIRNGDFVICKKCTKDFKNNA